MRQPWVAAVILISAIVTGLASFTSSLDKIRESVSKLSGSKAEKPVLPKILRQGEEDCVRADHACQVDLWLQNPSDKPLYVTALSLKVRKVQEELTLGKIEPSSTYAVNLTGLTKVGMTRKVQLSQEIPPQASDRFVIVFGAKDLHDRFREWELAATLETGQGNVELRPLAIKLPWDVAYSASPPVALPASSGATP